MVHKKSLLTKYLSGTESSDCRSPRHDGKNWFIPETSLSGPSEPENRNTLNVNPGTSNQKEEEKSTSGDEKFPEDNLDDISVTVPDTTPSSGEKFPEDKSGTKSTSEGTIPYLGTEVHPIEAFSSGSPPSDGHTTQVISGGTTEVISVTDSSTTTDEEYTYVPVTLTPVKKMHQHFLTKMELGTLQICHQQYLGPQKPHQTRCQVMGVNPVQIFQNLNWTTFWIKIWKPSNPTTILHKICTRAEKDNILIQC